MHELEKSLEVQPEIKFVLYADQNMKYRVQVSVILCMLGIMTATVHCVGMVVIVLALLLFYLTVCTREFSKFHFKVRYCHFDVIVKHVQKKGHIGTIHFDICKSGFLSLEVVS